MVLASRNLRIYLEEQLDKEQGLQQEEQRIRPFPDLSKFSSGSDTKKATSDSSRAKTTPLSSPRSTLIIERTHQENKKWWQ
mmetsp:Transcript_23542/g.38365  ORF Transcript_23542/g.38365 Transcript_23542/m.38365 type:complete len:81 (+) Transcript_23542:391-633(+)